MKKFLKKLLIVLLCIILFVCVWAWLTKLSIIPNWFNIKFIEANGCLPWYEKKYWNCHRIWWPKYWWRCLNCEYFEAARECEEYYKMPDVVWYSRENYEMWVEEKHPDYVKDEISDVFEYLVSIANKWGVVDINTDLQDLSREQFYDEWVNEKFDWYQDALREYEKHQAWCRFYTRVMKPIIYLYPVEEEKVHVALWFPENLSHTYPKYNVLKWRNLVAQSDWKLINLENWRELYALYWEWISNKKVDFSEWFVVAWKDIIPFLEEKLEILWLNEREAEEFIVYRLPQMEDNEWNLIRFETREEQDIIMPLNIEPKPDTIIRVMMDWKSIEQPIEIAEQKLYTPERTGFVVIEWGWTEIE